MGKILIFPDLSISFALVGHHDLYPQMPGLYIHQRGTARFGLCYPTIP